MSTGKDLYSHEFGERIQARAKELGYKQSDIAKITGVAKSSVNRWWQGAIPRGQNAVKLRKALKVSQEWLDGNVNSPGVKDENELYNYLTKSWEINKLTEAETHLLWVPGIVEGELSKEFPEVIPLGMLTRATEPLNVASVRCRNAAGRLERGDMAVVDFNDKWSEPNSEYALKSGKTVIVCQLRHNALTDEIIPFVDGNPIEHDVVLNSENVSQELPILGRIVGFYSTI